MITKIESIVKEVLEVSELPVEFNEDTSFFEDLQFDSLMFMTLIFKCEEAFDIIINPDDLSLEVFKSVQGFIDYLETQTVAYKLHA